MLKRRPHEIRISLPAEFTTLLRSTVYRFLEDFSRRTIGWRQAQLLIKGLDWIWPEEWRNDA